MIVTCPSCAARYRLSDSALAKPAWLKCAACGHRWVPVAEPAAAATPPPPPPRPPITEADEDAAMRAVQEQIRARWQDAVTPVVPSADELPGAAEEAPIETPPSFGDFDEPEAAPGPAPSTLLRNMVALIAGAALTIAAVGLWVGRNELATIPMVGEMMAQITPPTPVEIKISGKTTELASGNRVLEVEGLIINRSKSAAAVPTLEATLSGPQGVALRWEIPPPRRSLGRDQQVAFASTVTGFPESATKLRVRAVQ